MKEIHNNQEIPIPEGLEQRLSALIAPQVRERQELALYEGSYTFINGQRIDDLGQIKADINEALAMAQMAEANVPADDFASQTERAILQATDDPEMQAIVQRMLSEN